MTTDTAGDKLARAHRLRFPAALLLALMTGAISRAETIISPWQPLFQGVDYAAVTNLPNAQDLPHLMIANAIRVDLNDPDVQFLPTPRITNHIHHVRETAGMTVTDYLRTHRLQVAINANFFDPGTYTLPLGTPMTVDGLSISRGEMVSDQSGPANSAVIAFDAAKRPTLIASNWPPRDSSGFFTAVAGTYPVLLDGVNIARGYLNLPNRIHRTQPRTAYGLSQDRRYFYLMTIDGRQGDEGYSEGAFDYETAALLQRVGAHDAVNMDGGGSTTLVVEDTTGFPKRLNVPSAVADSGRERTVGSHFGIYARPYRSGFIRDMTVSPEDRTALITWQTAGPATSQVQYGPTTDLSLTSELSTDLVTNHVVRLTGLSPRTGYYFRLLSATDQALHVSSNYYFTTTNYVTTNLLFDLEQPWKFTSAGMTTPDWTNTSYDDSGWEGQGPGLLWVDVRPAGPNAAVEPKRTLMPANTANLGFPFVTYYFRTRFEVPRVTADDVFRFTAAVDDGAVFYLNGREIHRLRMPVSGVDALTLASGFPCDGDATCLDSFELSSTRLPTLTPGENVLAVEVHNYDARSADITFGLTLEQLVPVPRTPPTPPTIRFAVQTAQLALSWGESGFVLESAGFIEGPWIEVGGDVATSFVVSHSDTARFFRLRQR